jgi:hypothetical protein
MRHLVWLAAVCAVLSSCSRPTKEDPQVAQLRKELEAAKRELADKQQQSQAGAAAQQKTPISDNSAAIAANKAIAETKTAVAKQAEAHEQLKQDVESMKPREFRLPAGTIIPARTTTEVDTNQYKNGSSFDAVLEHDLVVDGTLLAEAGARVHCVVVAADPGGRVKGKARLSVAARTIAGVGGNVIAVKTHRYSVEAASTKKKDTVRTGIATGAGAIIGGIAGGGKGAAIGAGAGAAAGVGTTMATRGAAAVIPSETLIAFKLSAPATVVLRK